MVAFVPVAFFALALAQEGETKKGFRERRRERKAEREVVRQERKERERVEKASMSTDELNQKKLDRAGQVIQAGTIVMDGHDLVKRASEAAKDLGGSNGSEQGPVGPAKTELCDKKKTAVCAANQPPNAISTECKENAGSTTTCTSTCEEGWRGDNCDLTCVDEDADSLLTCLTEKQTAFSSWEKEEYDTCGKILKYNIDSCSKYPEVNHCCSLTCNEEACSQNNQAPSSRSLSIFTLVALSIV